MPAGRAGEEPARPVGDGILVIAPEPLALAHAPDERRLGMACERGRVADDLEQAERLDRLGLPLEREGLDRLDDDGIADESSGRGADEHIAGCRGLLEACGDVDGVSGDERLGFAADDDFSGIDADPRLQAVLHDRRSHLRGGSHSAECVVLMRDRYSEDRHDRVPDELLDAATVPLDDRCAGPRSSGACGHAAPPDRWTPRARSSRRGRRRGS